MRLNLWGRQSQNKPSLGQELCCVGWGLFAVAMFLPAFHTYRCGPKVFLQGWEVASAALQDTIRLLKGEIGLSALYSTGFTFAILVMFLSPLLVQCSQRSKRWTWSFLLLLSALYLSCFVTDYMFSVSGYYAWVMSFWVVALGVLKLRAESLRKAKVEAPFTPPLPRTPEEMAAERELKDFLRGTTR
jgi:hypothetical protein